MLTLIIYASNNITQIYIWQKIYIYNYHTFVDQIIEENLPKFFDEAHINCDFKIQLCIMKKETQRSMLNVNIDT